MTRFLALLVLAVPLAANPFGIEPGGPLPEGSQHLIGSFYGIKPPNRHHLFGNYFMDWSEKTGACSVTAVTGPFPSKSDPQLMAVLGEYETELVDGYGDPQHKTDDGPAGFRTSWVGVPRFPKIFGISLTVAEADGEYVLAANFNFNIEGCGGSVLEP